MFYDINPTMKVFSFSNVMDSFYKPSDTVCSVNICYHVNNKRVLGFEEFQGNLQKTDFKWSPFLFL